jgi:3-dehydroquinate dehydratase I
MHNARICAVVTDTDVEEAHSAERLADLFEVRIDLIGAGWEKVASALHKPWIATNRDVSHGGKWQGSEKERMEELFKAINLGAHIVDIEMDQANLAETVQRIKANARCLVSFHDAQGTPPIDTLVEIVKHQLAAGADICKVVGTASTLADSKTMLGLIKKFPWADVIAFAMGPEGLISRVLSPLAGAYLTYASLKQGKESAPGQITVEDIHSIYRLIEQ